MSEPSWLPLLLALRYLRMSQPRTLRLLLIPIVALALLGALFGVDALAQHAHSERILELHAEWAQRIGYAKWFGGLICVLLLAFVMVIRQLTIFTTISTYGMFLGCAALVLVLGVMSGFESDIKHKILGTHAHIEVTRVDEAFTEWRELLPKVQHAREVVAATPVLSSEAMISSSSNRQNVIVRGIDPESIGAVTEVAHAMELGDLDSLAHPEHIRPLPPPLDEDDDDELRVDKNGHKKTQKDDARDKQGDKPAGKKDQAAALPKAPPAEEPPRQVPPGIIIGRELAKTMGAYVGDDVSMLSPSGGIGPSGAVPSARPYRVAGIFYTGMFEYDSKLVYLTLASAQRLFDQRGEVSAIEIKVKDSDDTEPTVAELQKMLGPGYEVTDWKALNGSLFAALALEKVVMFIILSFIILVAAFSIVANGHMIASQKIAEIAILKSMGATDGTIATAFVLLGTILGTLGVLAGVAGGLFGSYALIHWGFALDPEVFYMTALPVRLDPREVATVAAAGVLVTTLATVYPAYMASRMTPVEGLREGGR